MATATSPDLRAKLEQVNSEISQKNAEAQKHWKSFDDAREAFAKAGSDSNRTDSEEFKKAEDEHKQYAEVAQELKELESVRNGIFSMLGEGPEKSSEAIHQPTHERHEGKSVEQSLSDRVAHSQEYKALLESGALNSERAGFNAKLADVTLAEAKALITGVTSTGTFTVPDVAPYVPQPRLPLKVINLITVGQTGTDAIQFAQQNAFTNVAAETAEATATTTGTKPEATIAFTKVTAAVKTIAHWVPATRRALADIGQLQTLIESQLRYGLQLRLEQQIVNGDGSGENLTGILNTSGILSQPRSSDTNADAIHKALTQVRLGYVEPNGVALHPSNYETIRLAKSTGDGQYFYGPPAVADQMTIWGLSVAVTPAVPANTGLVGDFRYGTLWMREGAQVFATDSHSDFFVKNLVAVLAELRAAFGVVLPAGFAKVTGLN